MIHSRTLLENKIILHSCCSVNLTQKRTSFSNRYKHGPHKKNNPDPPYFQWLKSFFGPQGKEFIKAEASRISKKPFRPMLREPPKPDVTYIFEHFDTNESLARWQPKSDSDTDHGFSTASLVKSPAGHALFKGTLDTTLPDDGITVNSGFCALIGPQKPRDSLFATETHWDWTDYNCLEIRYRGDGRKYSVVLNTGTYDSDLEYYDAYAFPLYSKGGPYWQTCRIPLNKFIFIFKGFIQDGQMGPPKYRIKWVAIALQDKINGPFSLEIDYIGLRQELRPFNEITPYEKYSFRHLNYKLLQVDCEAPE